MKIINTSGTISLTELTAYLREKINPIFRERRQTDISFDVEEKNEGIEISNDELYEAFLFRIEQHERELHIIKSEHYTDDVNVLTIEDIINELLLDFLGNRNIKFVGEES